VNLDRPAERTVIGNCPNIHSFALSPDGRLLAACQDKTLEVKVWETANGRVVRRLPCRQENGSAAIAFSPDGRWLVVGGLRDYRLFAVPSWKAGPAFPKDRREFWAGPLAFSGDGCTLTLACSLLHLQLVDVDTRQTMATLSAPNAEFLQWVCLNPDGSQLAAVTQNHVVQLWDLRALRRQLRDLGLDWDRPPYKADNPRRSSAPKVAIHHHTIEAEYWDVVAAADCPYSIQDMDPWGREHWSNGHQLFCSSRMGGFVEFELALPRSGRYALEVRLTRAPAYGLVEVTLDGKQMGKPFDGFQDRLVPPSRVPLGAVPLAAGSHRLRFTVVGKNPKAANYFMGIDCLVLTPVK
jgi:hypothetical protein